LQSKPDIKSYFPVAELAGLFITASSVTFCYFLTSRFAGNEPTYQWLIFFATLFFYSTDHVLDLRKYAALHRFAAWFFIVHWFIVLVSGVMLLFFTINLWSTNALVMDFMPAVVSAAVYVVIIKRKESFFLAVKMAIIALTATLVIHAGFAGDGCIPRSGLLYWIPAFAGMLFNVLVSVKLDQRKDRGFGNGNFFDHINLKTEKWIMGFAAAGTIIAAAIAEALTAQSGILLCTSAYVTLLFLMMLFAGKRPVGIYRVIPDALLPLLVLYMW